MTRTQEPGSGDHPVIPSPPDQGKTRPDWAIDVRPLGLAVDLTITCAVTFCLGWALGPTSSSWTGVPLGILGAALFYVLRRGARRVADAQAAAIRAGMYAHRAEELAAHPQHVVLGFDPATHDPGGKLDEMIKGWQTPKQHLSYATPPEDFSDYAEDSSRRWTGSFEGGPLDDTEVSMPADPLGLPPLVHVHTDSGHFLRESLRDMRRPGPSSVAFNHYRLVNLDRDRRIARYEVEYDSFTVTFEDYERWYKSLSAT